MKYIKTLESFTQQEYYQLKERVKDYEPHLNRIVEKLSDFEDRGYVLGIDLCYYEFTDDKKHIMEAGIVFCKYLSGQGEEKMEYSSNFENPSDGYFKYYNDAFNENRICFRVVFMKDGECVDVNQLYNEIKAKLQKMDILNICYMNGVNCAVIIQAIV